MEFKISGIHFSKDQLIEVDRDQLSVGRISLSHIFFITKNQKNSFLILRAGDIVDQQFVDKYLKKDQCLWRLEITNQILIDEYKIIFQEIDNAKSELKRIDYGQILLQKYQKDYCQDSQASYLTFALACQQYFYHLPKEIIHEYSQKSYVLYSRAILSASFAVVTALIYRITDLAFVRDFYNTVFLTDFGLLDAEEIPYQLIQACEFERHNPGRIEDFFDKTKMISSLQKQFKDHPLKSLIKAQEISDYFKHPEILEVLSLHHEKENGKGFPKGLYYSALADFETWVMFCDNLVPFDEHVFKKNDGQFLVKENLARLYQNKIFRPVPISRVIQKWRMHMQLLASEDEVA